MATKTTLDTLYLVNSGNRKISLEIVVGDEGQTSLTNVKLETTSIAFEHRGNLEKTEIGKNLDLNGKTLRIIATVADTSKKSNLTSINIKISGGFLARSYPLYKLVDTEGDSADYVCNIEFYNPTA